MGSVAAGIIAVITAGCLSSPDERAAEMGALAAASGDTPEITSPKTVSIGKRSMTVEEYGKDMASILSSPPLYVGFFSISGRKHGAFRTQDGKTFTAAEGAYVVYPWIAKRLDSSSAVLETEGGTRVTVPLGVIGPSEAVGHMAGISIENPGEDRLEIRR